MDCGAAKAKQQDNGRRGCVTMNVGKGLLSNAVQRAFGTRGEGNRFAIGPEEHLKVGSPSEAAGQGLHGLGHAHPLERWRIGQERHCPDLSLGLANQALHFFDKACFVD